MHFSSPDEFLKWPQKAITLFGMSGAGKTTLSQLLRKRDWFSYSVDYRIGTHYMGEHIVDNFKREAMKQPILRQLLRSDSIYISSNISFDNLNPLSCYLGKPGNPELGGLAFDEYCRRQEQHRRAEISALLDVPEFIEKSRDIYGYMDFICDSGGSLCEVVCPEDENDPVLNSLAENTMLVYLRGTPEHTRTLVERFRHSPKPMYYAPDFLQAKWVEYKKLKQITNDNAVNPDDFAIWGFEQLLAHRLPIYEAIASRHGYVVDMKDVANITSEADFLSVLAASIARQQ